MVKPNQPMDPRQITINNPTTNPIIQQYDYSISPTYTMPIPMPNQSQSRLSPHTLTLPMDSDYPQHTQAPIPTYATQQYPMGGYAGEMRSDYTGFNPGYGGAGAGRGEVFNRYGFGAGGFGVGVGGSSGTQYPPPPDLGFRRPSGPSGLEGRNGNFNASGNGNGNNNLGTERMGETNLNGSTNSANNGYLYSHPMSTEQTTTQQQYDNPPWMSQNTTIRPDNIPTPIHTPASRPFQLTLPPLPQHNTAHAVHPQNHSRRSTITDDGMHGTGTGTGTGTNTGGTGTEAHSEVDVSRPNTAERAKWDEAGGAGIGDGGGLRGRGKGGTTMKGENEIEDGDVGERLRGIAEVGVEGDEDGEGGKIDHRKRKRNRTIRSCVPCHNHKRKCDRRRPCGRCTALGLTGTCVYEVDEARDMNDPTIVEEDRLRKRVAELEQVVRELRQRQPIRSSLSNSSTQPLQDSDSANKKRRVIVDRFARFKLDEAAMAAVAAAARQGRGGSEVRDGGGDDGRATKGEEEEMGGVERVPGGIERRKSDYGAEPYNTHLLPGEEMVSDMAGRKTFLGAPAGKSMLRRLKELTTTTRNESSMLGGEGDLLVVPEDTAFTGWFPDMRKTFPFTTIWSHENFSGEIIGLLPSREQSELLLESWREEVCSFFLAWHTPTLEGDYKKFFSMPMAEKMNVPLSSLAVYLMICSLGCMMRASESEIFGTPDRVKTADYTQAGASMKPAKDLTSSRLQSELYLSGAYQALRLCSFMSNPSIYTIQAQILINIYLLNSERAADGWAQTGSLVRQCVAMGLHVDPVSLDPKISMRDAEVRRRIWWTVAGLDALFCVSFGRPSVIHFYKTNLPQDRTDDNLSDQPGSAQVLLPPSNVLRNETTEMSYHAAYFQLTIPSYELLDRIFHVDRKYSRSAIYGWFSPSPTPDTVNGEEDSRHTYDDAIRLADDIFQWYSHVPREMRFDIAEDTPERLLKTRTKVGINQSLALCVKTFMIVLILHRPYLRADPLAYPESSEICWKAAHLILSAYHTGSDAKASIFWSWWTMSYRAFHAGAVCAFLAVRQPGSALAKRCLEDLRGAITILEDRTATWNAAHPVQADLTDGLLRLEKLAAAAMEQAKSSPSLSTKSNDRSRLSVHWTPTSSDSNPAQRGQSDGNSPRTSSAVGRNAPLAQIRGFPEPPMLSPIPYQAAQAYTPHHLAPNAIPEISRNDGGLGMGLGMGMGGSDLGSGMGMGMGIGMQVTAPDAMGFMGDGFSGTDTLALPQFWASVFGIKMEGDGQAGMNAMS